MSITPVGPGQETEGFEDFREKAAYVAREYFSSLHPNDAFLVIARRRDRCGEGGTTLRESACFGMLAAIEPLFLADASTETFVLLADRHLMDDDGHARVEREIRIAAEELRDTPLTYPFSHPRHGRYVRAFEIVVGLEAIEERCLSLMGYTDSLPRKFFSACARLGWKPCSARYREARERFRQQLAGALFAARFSAERRGALLSQAVELGFDKDTDLVAIGGRRMESSAFIEDIRRITASA